MQSPKKCDQVGKWFPGGQVNMESNISNEPEPNQRTTRAQRRLSLMLGSKRQATVTPGSTDDNTTTAQKANEITSQQDDGKQTAVRHSSRIKNGVKKRKIEVRDFLSCATHDRRLTQLLCSVFCDFRSTRSLRLHLSSLRHRRKMILTRILSELRMISLLLTRRLVPDPNFVTQTLFSTSF